MEEIKFSKKEETIMQEAFMTGRIYNSLGEKENPHEIQTKLKENCVKALKRENIPLDGLVMAKIAEAIDRTKWKLKGITRTKTMNMEDGFDKQILLKIGEIQIDVCDAVMEEILSNFSA